jgi:trk system potassium uptake protein TrkH
LFSLTGLVMLIVAGAMVPSLAIAWLDGGPDLGGFQSAASTSAACGVALMLATRRSMRRVRIRHRDGFLIVTVGWIAAGLAGALPFYLYPHLSPDGICDLVTAWDNGGRAGRLPVGGEFCSFTNAAFESISGFTTTGASILTGGLWDGPGTMMSDGRPGLPRGILLWRSVTHFLGGMGIIVLGVAILPLLGVGGMELFKAEVPGPTTDKLAPRVSETARLLWKVYVALVLAQSTLLLFGGVDAFSALNHAMSTMATGGFSLYGQSVLSFGNAYVEWVIIGFMYAAGINFTLHFLLLGGQWTAWLRDAEWRAYTGVIVVFSIATGLSLFLNDAQLGLEPALRAATFQVLAILTTTGFASADFESWTYAPLALLLVTGLLISGGMSGSTAGGMKVMRHLLMLRQWIRELLLVVHPSAVRPVRLGPRPVSPAVMRGIASFFGVWLALSSVGAVVFTLDGQDLLTAVTASLSALGNVGPGLGAIGPMDSWAGLGDLAKWFACLLMLLGRLEIYTVLVLLSPAYWRR